MKKKFFSLLSALLALWLCGCAATPTPVEDTAALEREKAAAVALSESYLLRITELEERLIAQREEQYIKESEYTARIRELEDRVAYLLATGGSGETAPEEVVFHYRVRDGAAVITGYEGASPFLTVPATLDGYPVKIIGERAFEGKPLTAVTLPESLTTIEWFAFYGCTSLADISIPAATTEIGYAVFDGCPRVTLVCPRDSFAERYAKSYGIAVVTR